MTDWLYHLKVLALGVPVVAVGAALVYGMLMLPWWGVVIPLGLFLCYCLGRVAEILWQILLERSQ